MIAPSCPHSDAKRFGKDRNGNQRFRCKVCGKTFLAPRSRPLGTMRLPRDKAEFILNLLLEGNSIRSTMRLTGVDQNTIMALVLEVGERCERYFTARLRNLTVSSAQCDELWDFTYCKERTRERKGYGQQHGDCWIHTGIDPKSKLLLAYHVGRRSDDDTKAFAWKLADAIAGFVQINTDGLTNYMTALPQAFGLRLSHAAVVKVFAGGNEDHKYSPARVSEVKKINRWGRPDLERANTSIIERSNLTVRTNLRRFTRLTIAFSKSRRHHAAMFAIWALWYNVVRPHRSLKGRTPAQAHGIEAERWSIGDLLDATANHF